MTDKDKAVQEAERVAAADEYFKARAWLMDTNDNRRIFEAGFDRAYALLSKLRAPVADERAAFSRAEISFPLTIPENRVYLAGPMTGYKDHNFPAFHDAAEWLRGFGMEVVNPADHGLVDGLGWADYMRWDLVKLAGCHSVTVLPGWEKSKGASLEVSIAQALGMPVFTIEGAPLASAPAEVKRQKVCVHFGKIGSAGSFPIDEGWVTIPDVTMRDLAERMQVLSSAPVAGEACTDDAAHEAFRDFADQHLTDGNGYAPVSTFEACSKAFNKAWPNREAAVAAAKAEYDRLHKPAPAAPQASETDFAKLQSAYVAACDRIGELLAEKQASEAVRDAASERLHTLVQEVISWLETGGGRADSLCADLRKALSAQPGAQSDGDDKWKPQTPQQIVADMRSLARSEGFDWPDPDSARPGAQRTGEQREN